MSIKLSGSGHVGFACGSTPVKFGDDVLCIDLDAGMVAKLDRSQRGFASITTAWNHLAVMTGEASSCLRPLPSRRSGAGSSGTRKQSGSRYLNEHDLRHSRDSESCP